jgi:hypothetical protein
MFFQLVLCVSIWLVGLVINCVRNFPPFYPLAMLGGFLWATGKVGLMSLFVPVCISAFFFRKHHRCPYYQDHRSRQRNSCLGVFQSTCRMDHWKVLL